MRRYLWLNLFAICTLILPHIYSVGQASSPGPGEAKLIVLSSTPERMIVRLQSPQYRVVDMFPGEANHQQVFLPGAEQSNDPGRPQLPQVTALIGVPPEGEVEVRVLADHSQRLPGRYRLAPAASPVPIKEDLRPGQSRRTPDPGFYASNQAYPEQPVSVGDYAWLRDQRLARLVISPFQYQPASRRLTWHRDLLVEIRFPTNVLSPTIGVPAGMRQPVQPFAGILSQELLNADIAAQWRNPGTLADTNQVLANAPSNPDLSTRYRIAIDQDGIYRLSYAALAAAGLPVDTLDATTLKMTCQGQEVAIYVSNNVGDPPEKLSPGEYVLFYGEKFRGERLAELYAGETEGWLSFPADLPDGTAFDWEPQFNATMLEKYTDTNVYWLKYGEASGLRMATVDGTPNGAPTAQTFRDTVRAEQQHYWKTTLFTSEETWFWERLQATITTPEITRTYTVTLPAVASGTYSATLRGELAAEDYNDFAGPDHHSLFYLNQAETPVVDDTWEGMSRYHFEAQFPQSELSEGVNTMQFVTQLTPVMYRDRLYFDWFEIEYDRLFVAENNQLDFQTPITGTWKYKIEGLTSTDLAVLNVTDAFNPVWVENYDLESYVEFQVTDNQPANYYVAAVQDLDSQRLELYAPPDVSTGADYVLISAPEFIDSLIPLASYRASGGLTTKIINVDDLYNQFNYGIYHPIAIKNFLRYAFANWAQPPGYVVLVGDGHWNFKGYSGNRGYDGYDSSTIYMPPYLVWADPWQGEVDSADLLATVVGDDPLADVAIARLPVNNAADLTAMIDKIILYESSSADNWVLHSLFVADNTPDLSGDFPGIADLLIQEYLTGNGYLPERIYQDDYGCEYGTCPEVNFAITNTLSVTGALLVNYIGHGGVDFWSNESIFLNTDIPTIANEGRLPVILSMTCLDGYWNYPGRSSLIEEIVRTPLDGAVAAFSPTGLGVSTGHDSLHRGFYDALFINGDWELAAAAQAAKLRLFARGFNFDLLHTFTMFGDPALRLNNSYQFEAGVDDATKSGDGGETVAYQLTITNTSSVTDSFEITYSTNTWPVELANAVTITEPVTSTLAFVGPLASGASAQTTISVTVPIESANLASDLVQVAVTSTGDRAKWQTIELSTTHVFVARMYLPFLQRAD